MSETNKRGPVAEPSPTSPAAASADRQMSLTSLCTLTVNHTRMVSTIQNVSVNVTDWNLPLFCLAPCAPLDSIGPFDGARMNEVVNSRSIKVRKDRAL